MLSEGKICPHCLCFCWGTWAFLSINLQWNCSLSSRFISHCMSNIPTWMFCWAFHTQHPIGIHVIFSGKQLQFFLHLTQTIHGNQFSPIFLLGIFRGWPLALTLTLVIIIWKHLGKWPEKLKQNRLLSPFLVILSCQKEPNISYHNGICNPPPSDYILKPGEKWVFRSPSTVPVVIMIYLLTLWPLSTLCEHSSHLSCLKQGIRTCTSLLWKHSTVHLPQSSGWYSNASWMMVFLTTLFKIHYSFIFTFFFSCAVFTS